MIKERLSKFHNSINDVKPRKGESKKDFISRFMHETKKEYPNIKQRYAVALSYWKRKDSIDDSAQELNPKIWNKDKELLPEIRNKITAIVGKFIDWLNEEEIEIVIKDVIIVGSNASYNYTNKSDLDVHIIVNENDKDMMKLYEAYKTMFNETYDIKLNGIAVEVYVQNDMEDLHSKGVYSLNRGWIKVPDISEFTQNDTEINVKPYIDKILKLEKKPSLASIESLLDEIYDLRQSSLIEEGETGQGNLIFKKLREKGYLDKLKKLKIECETKDMSIK